MLGRFPQTVTRYTSNRFAIERTFSPLAFAVRIASPSLPVSGVRDRLVAFDTIPGSGSTTTGCSLAIPCFACSCAELSRLRRRWVFALGLARSGAID